MPPLMSQSIFPPVKGKESDVKVIATNRRARHDYQILEVYEAGLVLVGTEVKSLRQGKASLVDSYAMLKKGEAYLVGMHIPAYDPGSRSNHDPTRDRKLLLHRNQLRKLTGRTVERGLTLIPLKLYFKGKVAKVELALARGKKHYDRRAAIADRDAQRELRRTLKYRNR